MFKQKKNKKFNYNPRFSKNQEPVSKDNSEAKEFVSKWRRETGHQVKMGSVLPIRTILLLLILLLLCMYVLDKNYL